MSVDLTGILMQGLGGAKVDGRMVHVGMIYNPQPRDPDEEALSKPFDGVRYLAGLYTVEELGLQMRRQGAHVGMDAADQWIALTDGGKGLEEFINVYFPRAVKILDFQHAAGAGSRAGRGRANNTGTGRTAGKRWRVAAAGRTADND